MRHRESDGKPDSEYTLTTGGKSKSVSLSNGCGQVSLREWQKLKSIYDTRNQEWRVLRKHVDGEVFSYSHLKIYRKVFRNWRCQIALCFMVAMCSFQVSLWSKRRPRNLPQERDSNCFIEVQTKGSIIKERFNKYTYVTSNFEG